MMSLTCYTPNSWRREMLTFDLLRISNLPEIDKDQDLDQEKKREDKHG